MFEIQFFYFIVIPTLIYCTIAGYRMRRVRKHDKVLYRMCAVRRNIMSLLRDRGFKMKKDDYMVTKDLLEFVSMTIHEYDECKVQVFNVRRFSQHIREYRNRTEEVKQLQIPHDKHIQALFKGCRIAMLRGFLAYTPFLKFEIVVKLMVALTAFLAKFGIDSTKRWAETMVWFQHEYNELPVGRQYIKA